MSHNIIQDTIYALASAHGVSGIAVIRISGPKAAEALHRITQQNCPEARRTALRVLKDYSITPPRKLDQAMVLFFQSPHSFTGEDVVELHVHGGPAVIEAVLSSLAKQSDLRLAAPGEFTRRAFENNKIDLTEAEAIGDLIHAETQAQHELALNQLEGSLSRLYEDWRLRLSKILAYAEAEIDFPDEDLPDGLIETIRPKIEPLKNEFKNILGQGNKGEKLRKGVTITLIGAPNAGKSSLLNCLANEDVAIVTDVAGTTRDVLDVRMNIGGYAVTLSDTAGLRDRLDNNNAHDAIEAEGIKRALKRAQDSDYKILVIDASQDIKAALDAHAALIDDTTFLCLNKTDLVQNVKIPSQSFSNLSALSQPISLSAYTKQGVDELLEAVSSTLMRDFSRTDLTVLTRARHREALQDALFALDRCLNNQGHDELLAEDLRLTLRALGRITGRVDVEDLLDIVFKDFCIGK